MTNMMERFYLLVEYCTFYSRLIIGFF